MGYMPSKNTNKITGINLNTYLPPDVTVTVPTYVVGRYCNILRSKVDIHYPADYTDGVTGSVVLRS